MGSTWDLGVRQHHECNGGGGGAQWQRKQN